jgi:hypothetical protein
VNRVTQQGWSLIQIASELGIDRNTVSDRLDRHGLCRTKRTTRCRPHADGPTLAGLLTDHRHTTALRL